MEQFPISNGPFKGILNHIITQSGVSNIKLTVSGSAFNRNPYNVLNYDDPSSVWTSNENTSFGQWLQIELTDRYLDLTGYAIESYANYPTHWDISISFNNLGWIVVDSKRNNFDLNSLVPGIYECQKKHLGYA